MARSSLIILIHSPPLLQVPQTSRPDLQCWDRRVKIMVVGLKGKVEGAVGDVADSTV